MRAHRFWLVVGLWVGAIGGCGSETVATDAGGQDSGGMADASTLDGGGADSGLPDTGVDPLDIDDDADGFSENEGDCDDADGTVSPSALEICDNGVDDDCDTVIDDVNSSTQVGPSPYLSAADSPWDPTAFEVFVLEDFEDHAFPDGVTASTFRLSSSFGASVVDSVDGDDGDPTNGSCSTCEAVWSNAPITITFDEEVLGGLPTHVGLVLTDASSADLTATLSAQSTCAGLGEMTSTITFGDGSIGGETAEDRFLGIVSPAGIRSVTIGVGGAFEMDHLQFGW